MEILSVVVAENSSWGKVLVNDLKPILLAIFAVLGAISIAFSVYLGFNLAKASDAGKRAQAKKRIINAIASLFIIIILVSVLLAYNTDGARNFVEYDLNMRSIAADTAASAGGEKVSLIRDGTKMETGVVFEKATGEAGITISDKGVVKISSTNFAGKSIYVNVYYSDNLESLGSMTSEQKKNTLKLEKYKISIRPSSVTSNSGGDDIGDPIIGGGSSDGSPNAVSFCIPVDYGTSYRSNVIPAGYINSHFKVRTLDGKTGNHRGADFGTLGVPGRDIYAARKGEVIEADSVGQGANGKFIRIKHEPINGVVYETVYLHLSAVFVLQGATVGGNEGIYKYGQAIGKMGNTGSVVASNGGTGEHLHFEIYIRLSNNKRICINPFDGSQYTTGDDEFRTDGTYPDFLYIK